MTPENRQWLDAEMQKVAAVLYGGIPLDVLNAEASGASYPQAKLLRDERAAVFERLNRQFKDPHWWARVPSY